MVIEKLTGESYGDVLYNNILNQYSDEAVGYYASTYPANVLANMIHGYMFDSSPLNPYNRLVDITDWNMSFIASAGAMIGNMHTLADMTHALYHNEINLPVS